MQDEDPYDDEETVQDDDYIDPDNYVIFYDDWVPHNRPKDSNL